MYGDFKELESVQYFRPSFHSAFQEYKIVLLTLLIPLIGMQNSCKNRYKTPPPPATASKNEIFILNICSYSTRNGQQTTSRIKKSNFQLYFL